MTFFRCAALIMLLASAGCEGDNALITVRYPSSFRVPTLSATVTLSAPGLQRVLSSAELAAPAVPSISTPTNGTITVTYDLRDATTSVSSGSVALNLHRDQSLGVTISVDSVNPARYCFGCAGSRSFSLAPAYRRVAADSVWVVWGANSISNPVVF